MRIAIQMDPIEGINPASDSSYLLGLGAEERGHSLFYYTPRDLFWLNGALMAHLAPLSLSRTASAYFTLGERKAAVLADSVDAILIRQDPPFHMGYLTATYHLEKIAGSVRVLNHPAGIRNAPEKLLVTEFPHLMPPTLISGRPGDIAAFAEQHGRVVAKKLYGHGGRDVFLFTRGDPALAALAETHWAATGEPLMVQAYLPAVEEGDKRIIVFDSEPVAVMRRRPAAGNFLANLAQGGSAEADTLTPRDREICAALGPALRRHGLYFAGVDVIGDAVIEINITSPTGLAAINRLYALDGDARMEMRFWKGLGGGF